MRCESGPLLPRRVFVQGLATLLAGAGLPAAPALARGLRTGEPAPPATLVTLDGARLSSEALRGSVVILTF